MAQGLLQRQRELLAAWQDAVRQGIATTPNALGGPHTIAWQSLATVLRAFPGHQRTEFVDLLLDQDYGEGELLAFREFLFGTSSEELERLAARMADEGLSSIELDSKVDATARDAGSILYEFFRTRFMQCSARRTAKLPGPRHTAEGYVMLAWLARQDGGSAC